MEYYVVSDLHQNVNALKRLFRQAPSSAQIVLLGDFFDHFVGAETTNAKEFAQTLLQLVASRDIKPIVLRGNHDNFIIGTANHNREAFEDWLANGGRNTLQELGFYHSVSSYQALFSVALFLHNQYADLLQFLNDSQIIVNEQNILFVHAGLDWSRPEPIHQTSEEFATWVREDYLFEGRDEFGRLIAHRNLINKTIVTGHTPISSIDHLPNNRILKLHHPDDLENVNRYLIDGASGSGQKSAHVNLTVFDSTGRLIHEEMI